MKRNFQLLALTITCTSAAFAMKYAPVDGIPIITTVNLLQRPVNNFSGCTSDSNTIAVGYDLYHAGFRMLCADAGRIGFWTTPVDAPLVGQDTAPVTRYLCPSGTALAGLQYIDGLTFPQALCGELLPDLQNGYVSRKVLFSTDDHVVEKLSKGPPETPGVVSCGPAGYIQTLKALRDSAGNLTGFTHICNIILAEPVTKSAAGVDLAVKTVNQTAMLGRNDSQLFRVDIFNLGTANVPDSNITLELRYEGEAWQVLPYGITCTPILAHSGVVDRIVVGERCSLAGGVALNGSAKEVSFLLKPLGPDITRPATSTPQPILSVKALLNDEQLQGADANAANDTAAFPVILH